MKATVAEIFSYTPDPDFPDRRNNTRFPMTEEVTYRYRHGKITGAGFGRCINMGSGGVLFTTTDRLPVGRTLGVSINWPALLDGACPLKFVATGPVVRSEEHRAAIRIDRYEFRTRGARSGLASAISTLRVMETPTVGVEQRG
jgi:hypothetical protein